MKDITNIAVAGEDGVVTYADDSKGEFQCSGTVATIITSLATTLKKECKTRIATGSRLRHMYTRDSGMISRSLNGTSTTPTAPTAINVEFMRLVRIVTSKCDSTLSSADPRIIALDVLRYAPAEAFSVVHPTPVSEIQLDRTVGILEQVGDYVRASNIASKIVSTGDAIHSINADDATFWSKKH